jgi:pimeloyl-ACP methyl ester carboxylesterase
VPLVVLSSGFGLTHRAYASFSRHLASWGVAVVGVDFSSPANHEQDALEVIATIDWALGESGPLADLVDPARIATAGHSLGGKVALYAAAIDARIAAVVAWDPVDNGGPPCFIDPAGCNRWSVAPNSFAGDRGMMTGIRAAVLLFGAPVGLFSPEEHHVARFWEGLTADGMLVFFPEGDHLNWPAGDPEERISKRTQLAWLLSHLAGARGLERFLRGDVLQGDVDRGVIEVSYE